MFDFFQILGFNQGEQLSHCEEMSDPNVCFPLNTVVTERIIIYPGTISVQIGNVRKSVEKYFPFFLHVLDIRWTHFMYITLFGDGHSPLNWTLYWKHQKMAHLTPCFKKKFETYSISCKVEKLHTDIYYTAINNKTYFILQVI